MNDPNRLLSDIEVEDFYLQFIELGDLAKRARLDLIVQIENGRDIKESIVDLDNEEASFPVAIRVADIIYILEGFDIKESLVDAQIGSGTISKSDLTAYIKSMGTTGLAIGSLGAMVAAFSVLAVPILGIAGLPWMAYPRVLSAGHESASGRVLRSRSVIHKFIALFFDEVKSKICKGKEVETGIKTSAAASVAALSSWLAEHFQIHSSISVGLAVAILILLMTSLKKAFCSISLEEYLTVVGIVPDPEQQVASFKKIADSVKKRSVKKKSVITPEGSGQQG